MFIICNYLCYCALMSTKIKRNIRVQEKKQQNNYYINHHHNHYISNKSTSTTTPLSLIQKLSEFPTFIQTARYNYLYWMLPSRHNTLNQCWPNVDAGQTLTQHLLNVFCQLGYTQRWPVPMKSYLSEHLN